MLSQPKYVRLNSQALSDLIQSRQKMHNLLGNLTLKFQKPNNQPQVNIKIDSLYLKYGLVNNKYYID